MIFTTNTHARRFSFSPRIAKKTAKNTVYEVNNLKFELSCINFKPFCVFQAQLSHMSLSIADRESNLHFAEYLNLQGKAKKKVLVLRQDWEHTFPFLVKLKKRAQAHFITDSCVF